MSSSIPKHLTVKSDKGKYLQASDPYSAGRIYLKFSSNYPNDPLVRHDTVQVNNPGYNCYWILNRNFQKYWCRNDDDWINADMGPDPGRQNRNMMFSVEKVNPNQRYFKIKNLGNNMLCRRVTVGDLWDCLKADVPDISPIIPEAKFEVEEAPPERNIPGAADAHI